MSTTDSLTASPSSSVEDQDQKIAAEKESFKVVKVLVWDLDNTVWDGTLLEGGAGDLRPGVKEGLEILDEKGVLHSIASKNQSEPALEKLQELGIDHFFLYPQIHWGSKAGSVQRIAEAINIGLDTVAFIDDQAFERDEVRHSHQEVRTFDADQVSELAGLEDFQPRFITDESSQRRAMYQADIRRKEVEEDYTGPQEDFLADLDMKFVLGAAKLEDLKRAEELTMRTNQLNTTGYTYSYDELAELRESEEHLLLIASLDDRYGTYGKIGLALVEKEPEVWNVKLLLMSCRVMSRGVGTIMLNHLMALANEAGVKLRAEFRHNGRNRMMLVTYKMVAGFQEIETRDDGILILENDLSRIQPFPEYVEVVLDD